MDAWFASNLGDAMLAGDAIEHIKTLFQSACARFGGSDEMAIFIRHESEGRLHCEARVYFSPAAACVAEAVDARVCQRPNPSSLGLLAGSENAWSVLFSEDSSEDR